MANFLGTNLDDILPLSGIGNGADDIFSPGLGNDTVDGGDGNDILVINYSGNTYLGSGAGITFELPTFSNGTNALAGYSGFLSAVKDTTFSTNSVTFSRIERFQITGTNASDVLRGGINSDILNGLGGDDTFTSGGGIDTIDGGTGIDTLTDADFSSFTINLIIDNTGNILSFSNGLTIKGVELFSNLVLGSGDDKVTFTLNFDDNINTGAGNDIVNSGAGKDTVNGGDGNDIINSGLGQDDFVDGGMGDDLLVVDYSTSTFVGGAG